MQQMGTYTFDKSVRPHLQKWVSPFAYQGVPICVPGLFFLGIWELILHPLIVEVGVYNMLPAAGCGRTAVPFAVAYQCGGGDQHIYGHKQNQNPCQDITGDFWDFFNPPGEGRIQSFDPDQRGNPPKKAVKEIDASSKVKGNVTVIPENLSENNLCKYAADIFIGTAQKGTDEENMSVRLILVFVR